MPSLLLTCKRLNDFKESVLPLNASTLRPELPNVEYVLAVSDLEWLMKNERLRGHSPSLIFPRDGKSTNFPVRRTVFTFSRETDCGTREE